MNDKKIERLKMVKAMEYIARQVNNEEVFEDWLMNGVADGDIDYGSLEINTDDFEILDYYTNDKTFPDLMKTFLRVMKYARLDGGLYCGGIVSK